MIEQKTELLFIYRSLRSYGPQALINTNVDHMTSPAINGWQEEEARSYSGPKQSKERTIAHVEVSTIRCLTYVDNDEHMPFLSLRGSTFLFVVSSGQRGIRAFGPRLYKIWRERRYPNRQTSKCSIYAARVHHIAIYQHQRMYVSRSTSTISTD